MSENVAPNRENTSLFDTIVAFFLEDEWPFKQVENEPALRLGFQGRHGRWTCIARAYEEISIVVFYSICPLTVMGDQRLAMVELITRANEGMFIGNFELDLDSGEVRFKTSLDVEGDQLSPALLKQLVYANVLTVDRYLPAMLAVIHNGATPVDALREVEQNNT